MKNFLLSVLSDALDYLRENLTTVLIIAGAVVAAIVVIVIIACCVRARRKKARRGGQVAEAQGTASPGPASAEPVPKENAAAHEENAVAAETNAPAAGIAKPMPAAESSAAGDNSSIRQPASLTVEQPAPLTAEQREELEKYAEQGRVTFIKPRPGMFIRYRYNRSFSAKLIQADEKVKRYYSQLKNALLAYAKVAPRVSWRHESFRYGRPSVAKFVIRGKTLCLCLALDPADYSESKYIVDDM